MAATFEVVVAARSSASETALYAGQAAQAAFDEIDRIENDLSSFIDASDVSRINRFAAGDPVRVSAYTFECLQLAARIYRETGGIFDVTIGALMACWRTPEGGTKSPSAPEIAAARARVGMNHVSFDEKNFTVALGKDGVSIDLGGIGKGYALDKASEVLSDWREDAPDIGAVLLHGGESTVLALGAPPGETGWRVSVGADGSDPRMSAQEMEIRDRALSGSGTQMRGRHIIDPRTARPAQGALRAWASAPSGAVSDALATAFMIMSPDEVARYCRRHADIWGILWVDDGRGPTLKSFGKR